MIGKMDNKILVVRLYSLRKLLLVGFVLLAALGTVTGLIYALKTPRGVTAVPSTAVPIAYWRLDENAGPSYLDSTGNNHQAVCTSCPTAVITGQVNGSQLFNGSTSTMAISADSAFDWPANSDFSIELWLKAIPGQTCAAADAILIGRSGAGPGSWSLGCTAGSGIARFQLTDTSGTTLVLQSTKVITDGAWHHIAGLRDGINGVNYLYVDGGMEVISQTQAYSGNFAPATADLTIGSLSSSAFFAGTIDEVAVYNGLLLPEEVAGHYLLSRAYDAACAGPIRIMPLGDSITLGGGKTYTDTNKYIGYRKALWQKLVYEAYSVDFVGGLVNGEFYLSQENFDPDHEGHAGFRDDEIAAGIYDWLVANPAEVILLHIGTNDLTESPADVANILDEIDRFDERIPVVLARIINRNPYHAPTTTFNDNVEAMALTRIANGDKLIIVDMEDGAGINYAQQPAGDMWDSLHPYTTGYNKMADVWFAALSFFIPVCEALPAITSPPVEVARIGELYQYQVDASGSPPPTYSIAGPPGMTVVEATGLISWTPSTTGVFNVVVDASNSLDVSTQTYDLTVLPAPSLSCEVGAISYWQLDETSSSVFADSVGTNDASCVGDSCPIPTFGRVGSAMSFDGNDEVNAPDGNNEFDFGKNGNFSFEFWVNLLDSTSCTGNKVFVGRRDGNLSVWVGCDGVTETAAFSMRDFNNQKLVINGSTQLTDNAWHHIAAVRDGLRNQNFLYVDGKLENSGSIIYSADFTSTQEINLGYFDVAPFYHMIGVLDEVAVYGRVLSPLEVLTHYLSGLNGGEYCTVDENPSFLPVIIKQN